MSGYIKLYRILKLDLDPLNSLAIPEEVRNKACIFMYKTPNSECAVESPVRNKFLWWNLTFHHGVFSNLPLRNSHAADCVAEFWRTFPKQRGPCPSFLLLAGLHVEHLRNKFLRCFSFFLWILGHPKSLSENYRDAKKAKGKRPDTFIFAKASKFYSASKQVTSTKHLEIRSGA